MSIHTRLNIPTVEQALRANGLHEAADKYAVQNSRNTIEIAACVNNMFDVENVTAQYTLIGLWLVAVVITVAAGFILQVIR